MSIHHGSVAPEKRNIDRWTELTGEMIDNSKRLVVKIDSHVGQVVEHIRKSHHEGGYVLLDKNPADDDKLWKEKEDLRREFYAIKALDDERNQYENDVTPVAVQNAIIRYIESFQDYVKATVDIWSFFESVAEEGELSVLYCPNCDREIEKDSGYCKRCGGEIELTRLDRDEEIKQIERSWDQLHAEFNEVADDVQIKMVKMDVEMNVASPEETSVGWEYCPDCGFENSVWYENGNTASCRLCQARWIESGLLFSKWKMIKGSLEGETLDREDWVKRGRSKNKQRKYEEELQVHH